MKKNIILVAITAKQYSNKSMLHMFRLIIGYVIKPDGSMDVVRSTDFELHKLGDDKNDPTDYSFNFTTASEYTSCMLFIL